MGEEEMDARMETAMEQDVDEARAEELEAQRVAELTDVSKAPAEEPADEMPFEERLKKLEREAVRHPLHREINYKILRYCQARHALAEVEDEIASYPEFRHATLNQHSLIQVLVRAGGLEEFDLDAEGEIVTPEQFEGLTEDQIDDLVATQAYQTTELGDALLEESSAQSRAEKLFEREPERKETYIELLGFIDDEPRTYDAVKNLLDGREVMWRINPNDGCRQKIQASVFVDRLERAGLIVWDNGWVLTSEGRDVLDGLAG